MSEPDLQKLGACIADLLPMSIMQSTEEEASLNLEDTVGYKSSMLTQEIAMYLAQFPNSGVTTFNTFPE